MEVLPNEKKGTTASFLQRAHLHFQAQGVQVRKLLTDNGSAYRSKEFKATWPSVLQMSVSLNSGHFLPLTSATSAQSLHNLNRLKSNSGMRFGQFCGGCGGAFQIYIDGVNQRTVLSRIVFTSAVDHPQVDPVLKDPEHQILGPWSRPWNALGLQRNALIVEQLGPIRGRPSFQIALKDRFDCFGLSSIGHQPVIHHVIAHGNDATRPFPFHAHDAADFQERDAHLALWHIPAAIAKWLTPRSGGPSVLQEGIPKIDNAQAMPDSLPSCC